MSPPTLIRTIPNIAIARNVCQMTDSTVSADGDIVERLRDFLGRAQAQSNTDIMREAADEIERLRAENSKTKARCRHIATKYDPWGRMYCVDCGAKEL